MKSFKGEERYERIEFEIKIFGKVYQDEFQVSLPSKEQTKEIEKFFYEAFKNEPVQHFSLDERIGFIEYYFENNSLITKLISSFARSTVIM